MVSLERKAACGYWSLFLSPTLDCTRCFFESRLVCACVHLTERSLLSTVHCPLSTVYLPRHVTVSFHHESTGICPRATAGSLKHSESGCLFLRCSDGCTSRGKTGHVHVGPMSIPGSLRQNFAHVHPAVQPVEVPPQGDLDFCHAAPVSLHSRTGAITVTC